MSYIVLGNPEMSPSVFNKRAFTKLQVVFVAVGIIVSLTVGFIYTMNSVSPSPRYSQRSESSSLPNENLEWRLQVDGLVQHPLNISVREMLSMPRRINSEIYCLPAPTAFSGVLVDSGNWTGVPLSFILEKAGISKDAVKVALYAEDGFTTDLTIAVVIDEGVIVAYEKDGEPLSNKLRLVVPQMWGYKWIHSLVRIEVVDWDFKGTYERQGFPDNANTSS
jgi:DMSO/TMAO reductase YedYZ molybdopterin-dependent catalytic subunit